MLTLGGREAYAHGAMLGDGCGEWIVNEDDSDDERHDDDVMAVDIKEDEDDGSDGSEVNGHENDENAKEVGEKLKGSYMTVYGGGGNEDLDYFIERDVREFYEATRDHVEKHEFTRGPVVKIVLR